MKYLIIYKNIVVAKFLLESDRNEYLKIIKNKHPKESIIGVYTYE